MRPPSPTILKAVASIIASATAFSLAWALGVIVGFAMLWVVWWLALALGAAGWGLLCACCWWGHARKTWSDARRVTIKTGS